MYSPDEVVAKTTVIVGGICLKKDKNYNCTEKDVGKTMSVKKAYYSLFFEKSCAGSEDIAILELTEDIPKNINHICLPQFHKTDELFDLQSTKLFSYGWGVDPTKKGFRDAPTPYLQKIDLGEE
ncbi:unnamed protein product [Cylicostephanus goldi]|uniref:Peptidase S1 domain-containing protein n=1 Tax=Cylicostephanus goldi TaxID=71465 RepID=A0A3P6TF22_CYLGO|nr:unnamed protein product [Cylicostephanus goldi]